MTLRPRRNVIHLAYHNYEHYSSIRPLGGPFDGVPRIHIHVVSPNASVEDLSRVDGGDGVTAVDGSDTAATRASGPPPSTDLEKLIMRSTGCVDLTRIRTLMAERRGHVDDVIEQLIEEMNAPTPAADEHGRGATPAFGASTAAHASVDTASPSRKHTMMTSGSGAPKPATTTAVLEPAPATRKMSARERKEQTKKRRKRDKMQREAVKAAMEGPSATAAVASPRAQQGLMPATMTAKLSVLRI